MKKELIDGKEFTLFDDLEELKWHYHKRLCNSVSNRDSERMRSMYDQTLAELLIRVSEYKTVAEVNELLDSFSEPCRVRATL